MSIHQLHSDEGIIKVGDYTPLTSVHGPGKRFAVWTQGCPILCAGCVNQEMLPTSGGKDMRISQIISMIHRQSQSDFPIDGVTFMGGEPMVQARAIADILQWLRDNSELNTILFSGFLLETLQKDTNKDVQRVLSMTDVIIDGPYVEELRHMADIRGSSNQQIHHLNKRRLENASFARRDAEFFVNQGDVIKTGFNPNEITP